MSIVLGLLLKARLFCSWECLQYRLLTLAIKIELLIQELINPQKTDIFIIDNNLGMQNIITTFVVNDLFDQRKSYGQNYISSDKIWSLYNVYFLKRF